MKRYRRGLFLGVGLIIERIGVDPSAAISIEAWKQLVAADADLRLRTEPYRAVNPRTGDRILIPVGQADAELRCDGQWLPFIWFRDGRLNTDYQDEFDDPGNPVRLKIAAIAKQLGAVVRSDVGDELLEW